MLKAGDFCIPANDKLHVDALGVHDGYKLDDWKHYKSGNGCEW